MYEADHELSLSRVLSVGVAEDQFRVVGQALEGILGLLCEREELLLSSHLRPHGVLVDGHIEPLLQCGHHLFVMLRDQPWPYSAHDLVTDLVYGLGRGLVLLLDPDHVPGLFGPQGLGHLSDLPVEETLYELRVHAQPANLVSQLH